jgi:hypothetical protein
VVSLRQFGRDGMLMPNPTLTPASRGASFMPVNGLRAAEPGFLRTDALRTGTELARLAWEGAAPPAHEEIMADA